MSGGSWDYFYGKIDDVAERLKGSKCIERQALGALMEKVAKAMYAIEWVDSGDWGEGDELEAIKEVLSFNANKERVNIITTELALAIVKAQEVLNKVGEI